jgi:transmembrane sensor
MTTNSELPASQDLASEARRWILRLRSGETNPSDVAALTDWRARSPAHRRALAEANLQWGLLQSVARQVERQQQDVPVPASDDTSGRHRLSRRAWLGGAIAASVGGAAYLMVRPPLELWPSLVEFAADYRTGIGERREIAFADKVSVEMNTRTSLSTGKAGSATRQIELIAGEVAVTAGLGAAAPSEPFVVVAGNGRASAVRARFDLRHDGQSVAVTCLEGDMRVECRSDVTALKAGQQITYDARGFGETTATDGRRVEAWRQGLLVFNNQPLAQVVTEINRYRRGRIVLMNDDIGRLSLDATFRLDRIDEAVPKITHLFGLKIRTLPGNVVLLS